jgi:hypothetical protein
VRIWCVITSVPLLLAPVLWFGVASLGSFGDPAYVKVHLAPCVESFGVYNIQKGNTDVEINFYMGVNDEKGKSREDYIELRILYFI